MRSMALVAALSALALGACTQGDAEKTGENMDSAIEEATQGEKNLSDGPLENAGEAVEGQGAKDPY